MTQTRCGALTQQPRTTSHYIPITYGTTYTVFRHEVRPEVKEAVPHPINPAACTQNLSLCICYVKRPYTRCPFPCVPALASSASGKEKEKKKKLKKKRKKEGHSEEHLNKQNRS